MRVSELLVKPQARQVTTYVKPLMRVNSLTILPPWFCTSFFAFSSSCSEAPDFRVTYGSQTPKASPPETGSVR